LGLGCLLHGWFHAATAAATAYAAFVGDGDPVDGLETIGQGNDPLTKVIGQGAQAAIELSYEHQSLHNPDCCC
jgi:hypothetical protein